MSDRDRLVELLKEADDATEVHDCDYPTRTERRIIWDIQKKEGE